MANNISAIKEIQAEIDTIETKLLRVDETILKINKDTVTALKNFQSAKIPSDVNKKIQESATYTEQLNAAMKEQSKLEKALITQIEKKKLTTESTNKALVKERFETQQLNKRIKEAAILSSKLSTEYQKQAVALTQMIRRQQDLALKQKLGTKLSKAERLELKKLTKAIRKKDAALKSVDANVGRFQRNVGNYKIAMQSAAGAARQMASALGLVSGAFLFVQVMRDAIDVVRDFEKQNATLSAILQVEKKDMQELTEDSIRLGSTTVKTAGQVTTLQIAYARLGFTQKEILDLTESTINGSIAMNSELDRTAALVGAVVNTFDDLSTTDAPKIIDILSLSTAKSALNFERLETGIPIVAGAANAAGVPFTKLVALMGKLSDSGIDVSTSSTALRNIFIESAAQGLNYSQILEKIKNEQDKLTAANDEFGKRAAVSATVLAQNIEATKELDEALQGAAGTAERMAEKELDTLDGALKLLRSSWEGYVLGVNESNDGSNKLKQTVQSLAKNLPKIIDTVIRLVKAFITYKAVLIASSLLTKGYTILTGLLSAAKVILSSRTKAATAAMTAFNTVSKLNPVGFLIGVLAAGAAAFVAFKDDVDKASEALKRMQTQSNETTKAIIDNEIALVETRIAAVDKEVKDREKATEKKLDIVNDEIDKTLNGTDKLYDDIGKIQELAAEEERKRRNKEVNEKIMSFDEVLQAAKENSKKLQEAGGNVRLLNEDEQASMIKESKLTDAQTEKIKKLEEIKKSLIKSKKELNTERKTDAKLVLEGSAAAYKKLISELEDERDRLATNSDEYQSYGAKIEKARTELEKLTDALEVIDKFDGEGLKMDFTAMGLDRGGFENFQIQQAKDEAAERIKIETEKNKILETLRTGDLENAKELSGKQTEVLKNSLDLQNQLLRDFEESRNQLIMEGIQSIFDARVAAVDRELEASENRFASLMEQENLSDEQVRIHEDQREKKRAEIQKKKEKAEKTAFLVSKAFAIAEIALNLAKTISAINLAASGIDAITPYSYGAAGAAFRAANIPTAILTAAAQTAIVVAQSIPGFKDGHLSGTYKGLAKINDSPRESYHELIERKSGKLEMYKDRNAIITMDYGDKVHPDANRYLAAKENYRELQKGVINDKMANVGNFIDSGSYIEIDFDKHTKSVVSAIKSKKSKFTLNQTINIGEDIAYALKGKF